MLPVTWKGGVTTNTPEAARQRVEPERRSAPAGQIPSSKATDRVFIKIVSSMEAEDGDPTGARTVVAPLVNADPSQGTNPNKPPSESLLLARFEHQPRVQWHAQLSKDSGAPLRHFAKQHHVEYVPVVSNKRPIGFFGTSTAFLEARLPSLMALGFT